MEKIVIEGGHRLHGEVRISGAKNSVLAIMPAAILAEGPCIINNIPDIADVKYVQSMLEYLGASITPHAADSLTIDTSTIQPHALDLPIVSKMRASYYFIGSLLARFGEATLPYPGGCEIGARPIDLHKKGLEALGAKFEIKHGIINVKADKLKGARIYFDLISVGATINVMIAATKAEGQTIIENAAREPYIVDTANFLNAMGAKIVGAGTDTIRIVGTPVLRPCEHTIIPDQMEAGTYMIAAAATKGDITLTNVIPSHLEAISAKLAEMGVGIEEFEDSVRVFCDVRTKGTNIKTMPYPGFPTDMQQPMSVLLAVSKGTSLVTENIFESRFKYLNELQRMGAIINTEGQIAVIEGVEELSGAPVYSHDLRAGAALVIAGLIAEGETSIENVNYIDRGYEKLEEKLTKLGAKIVRVKKEIIATI